MTIARKGLRFKTVDELFDSNEVLILDPIFVKLLELSGGSLNASRLGLIGTRSLEEIVRKKFTLITLCDDLESMFEIYDAFHGNFYILPDKLWKTFEVFRLRQMCPFKDSLQINFYRLYEAGFHHYWEHLIIQIAKKYKHLSTVSEDNFLNFGDIHGIFYVHVVGLVISCLLFVFEIFCFNHQTFKSLLCIKIMRAKKNIRKSFSTSTNKRTPPPQKPNNQSELLATSSWA